MAADLQIHALRRQLAAEIVRSLGPMSAYSIAPSYGIPQPRMSELERGRVDRCSVEWLIRRIHRMGGTVTISVELGDTAREWMWSRTKRGMNRAPDRGHLP
jgi:predicted XRE-type DNA-binding protein